MNRKISKILIIGVIATFFTLAFAPTINAVDKKEFSELKEIEVKDYKPDGSIITRTISFTKTELKELKNKILNSETLEERFSVLKEFNIVSNDQTLRDWQEGMHFKADKIGISKSNYLTRTKLRLPTMVSVLNKVNSVSIGGTSPRLGISPLLRIIEKIIKLNLPRVDILDLSSGLFNVINIKNPLAKNTIISTIGFTGHIGFVGTSIKFPLLMHVYSGYSALTIHIGLGIRLKDNYLPSL